jgi:CRISPR-associated endonuclease/helicase Cas3
MASYFAHSGQQPDFSDWQPLKEHLLGVAALGLRFAQDARPGDSALLAAAQAASLLHDLGKYRPEFQLKLKKILVQREKTFHKQAGAAKAAEAKHLPVAFAIAGHHGGMPDAAGLKDLVRGEAGQPLAQVLWPIAVEDLPALASLSIQPLASDDSLYADLFTRLVFSCLVDADWSDTGEHERKVKDWPRDPEPQRLAPEAWLVRLQEFIRQRARACRDPAIARIRDEVLTACLAKAVERPGLFLLTVPTGGGKTLSGLAFALKHAAQNGLRRIIYVAPYLSILDQNARVIRQALGFGPDAPEVFEHHSLAEPPGDENQNELARETAARRAENWDAPVVLTTNVQLFESLFSNKPGRCRKLHNIARSVIILDECQTLPPDLVAPTCSMLGQLAAHLGSSVVLCTATQPAFDHADMPERLTGAREIIPLSLDLFTRLRRVKVSWPSSNGGLSWQTVAARMLEKGAALCIVNTRRAACELFQELKKEAAGDAFHLSTSMCPAHRLEVLDKVRGRLETKQRCFLVSTQLIEAGVDVDFPFVLRELAPLEAIIQAAGRCNREGLLWEPDGSPGGQVLVFRSAAALAEPKRYYPPDRWYKAGRFVVESVFLNNGREPRIDVPEDIREYFERLYRTGSLDAYNLQAQRERGQFASIAQDYRLIEDDGEPVVVASWKEREQDIAVRLQEARRRGSRSAYRRLSPFQVNLRRHELKSVAVPPVEEIPGVLVWRGGYDHDMGLTADNVDTLLLV